MSILISRSGRVISNFVSISDHYFRIKTNFKSNQWVRVYFAGYNHNPQLHMIRRSGEHTKSWRLDLSVFGILDHVVFERQRKCQQQSIFKKSRPMQNLIFYDLYIYLGTLDFEIDPSIVIKFIVSTKPDLHNLTP